MNRTICTAANGRYFGSVVNLIGSLHQRHPEGIGVRVYDLGLPDLERRIIEAIDGTTLHEVPHFCPHALTPDLFAWKIAAIRDTLHAVGGAVLWLDAGIEALLSLAPLFTSIEANGCLFNVSPYEYAYSRIGSLTTKACLAGMNADSPLYRDAFFVNAGIQGYMTGHPACAVIEEAYRYAADISIIGGSRAAHRQDQSIVSILRVRHGLPARYWLAPAPDDPEHWPTLYDAACDHPVPIEDAQAIMLSSPGYLKVKRRNAEYAHSDFLRPKNPGEYASLSRVLLRCRILADSIRAFHRLRRSLAHSIRIFIRG